MLMRVSVGIHKKDIKSAIKTYNLLSKKYFTHSTPTLFSSGMPKPYLSSCFLLQMESDSINGIYNTLKKCAKISQSAGGIGLNIHTVVIQEHMNKCREGNGQPIQRQEGLAHTENRRRRGGPPAGKGIVPQ